MQINNNNLSNFFSFGDRTMRRIEENSKMIIKTI